MKSRLGLLAILVLVLSPLACGIQVDMGGTTVPTLDVAVVVKATTDALTAQAPTPSSGGDTLTSPPPAATVAATVGPAATATLSTTPMSSFPEMGTITGSLMYPASGIPALRIVAFPTDGSAPSYTETAFGQNTYTFDLPVGTYHVVAYVIPGGGFSGGVAGGYSQMVPCGLKYGCDDHSLITVTVTAGATTAGVDPNDYYAPDGSFPPNPVP